MPHALTKRGNQRRGAVEVDQCGLLIPWHRQFEFLSSVRMWSAIPPRANIGKAAAMLVRRTPSEHKRIAARPVVRRLAHGAI